MRLRRGRAAGPRGRTAGDQPPAADAAGDTPSGLTVVGAPVWVDDEVPVGAAGSAAGVEYAEHAGHVEHGPFAHAGGAEHVEDAGSAHAGGAEHVADAGSAHAGVAEHAGCAGLAGSPDSAGDPGSAGPTDTVARHQRRRRDPWRTAFFGVLVLAILAGAGWALLGSSLLVVRHEEVAGNKLVATARILAAAGIRPGTPMASVDTSAAAGRVEQVAQVLTASVTRSWPDTIVISVLERTPALAVASAGGFALVDGSGVTVRWSRYRPAGMQLLVLPPAQLRGNAGVRAAVAVLGQLPRRLRRLIVSVSAPSAATVTFSLRGGVIVVWGGPGTVALKAAELSTLLRTHARYIDVSDPARAVTQ